MLHNNYYDLNLNREQVYFNSFLKANEVFWIGNDTYQKAEIIDGEYYFEALENTLKLKTRSVLTDGVFKK